MQRIAKPEGPIVAAPAFHGVVVQHGTGSGGQALLAGNDLKRRFAGAKFDGRKVVAHLHRPIASHDFVTESEFT